MNTRRAIRHVILASACALAAASAAAVVPDGVATQALPLVPAAAAAQAAQPPTALRVVRVRRTDLTLRWRPRTGATSYLVYRDGRLRGEVRTASFTDTRLRQASFYTYRVQAKYPGGRLSARTSMVPATTRAAARCDRLAHPNGNDAWPGTTQYPFRTVGKLVSSLGPGVVGCVQGSFRENVTMRRPGRAGRPAVLRNRPGHHASVRGRFWVSSTANHVVVQGLRLDGRHGSDLPSPTINGNYVKFIRNDVTNNNTAICFLLGSVRGYGVARRTTLDSNRIHHCGVRPAQNHHHGIYLENSRGARIVNNVIYANADRGIQLYPNALGSLIARNVIDGNGQGIIFSGNHGYASSRNAVVDNVISNSRLRYNIEHWWPGNHPIGTGNRARRNCLWNGRQGNVAQPALGYSVAGSRVGDPRYRDRRRGDFRARSGSACRTLLMGIVPLRPF